MENKLKPKQTAAEKRAYNIEYKKKYYSSENEQHIADKKRATKEYMDKARASKKFYCALCDVAVISPGLLQSHYTTKKHITKYILPEGPPKQENDPQVPKVPKVPKVQQNA